MIKFEENLQLLGLGHWFLSLLDGHQLKVANRLVKVAVCISALTYYCVTSVDGISELSKMGEFASKAIYSLHG